jgi:hypothetical protein
VAKPLQVQANGEVADQALSAALQEELKFEEASVAEAPPVPEFLSKFKKAGIWQASAFLYRLTSIYNPTP